MKKIFLFTLLLSLTSLFLLLRVPAPVLAGYCGDGTCGAGEDCYNCPGDCPTCPPPPPPPPPDGDGGGWEPCGEHICPNQVDWVPYACTPSCDSPDQCQDLSPCPGDVPPGDYCVNDADCFPNNPFCPGATCAVMSCINGSCISDCVPCEPDGDGDGNSPPFISTVYTDKGTICQATSNEIVTISAVYKDANGTDDITQGFLGLAPCGNTGDAYCTNFERNLANYFGGVYQHNLGNVRVAEDSYGTSSCSGGSSNPCPWGSTYSLGSLSVPNDPGTVTVTNVQRTVGSDLITVSWTLRFNGIPANAYRIYGMARDTSGVFQTGVGQPARWWWYGNFTVEECGISGTVYDSADTGTTCSNLTTKPAVGGAVVTGDLLGDGVYTNTSLGNGSYSLSNIPKGTYVMSAAKDGYRFEGLVCDGSNPIGSFPIPPSKTNINIGISSRANTWFQTKEGDVHTGGSISVPVPDGEYFCEKGDGGTPGVVSYQTGTPDFSSGSVSETDWLANTSFSRKKYEYFRQLLGISPDDEDSFDSFADIGDDIVYYSSNGVDINTGAGSFPAGKKAAILVNGNVNINDNISVPDGSFLAFIALGNIEVADSVSQINGVYITDSKFEAGTNETTALECYGTFIANSFEMEGRDLGETNETTPGVKFIYRPDLWLNAPKELLIPSYTWQELAP